MTRIFTTSSGSATPNTACCACASHGLAGAPNRLANGARMRPSRRMLAAPSANAVQTFSGGPGRSPAATTSHRISSAGATAAVPSTVGRDSSRFIWTADRPFFALDYAACVTTVSSHARASWPSPSARDRKVSTRSATAADAVHLRVHHHLVVRPKSPCCRACCRAASGERFATASATGSDRSRRRIDPALQVSGPADPSMSCSSGSRQMRSG